MNASSKANLILVSLFLNFLKIIAVSCYIPDIQL